jgi:putative peptide zinc metalloprotease protein
VTGGDVLAVRPLSVVPEGDEFVVGDPATGVFVVLPAVAVRVIELLREERTVDEVAAEVGDVDVADFAGSLVELGFAGEAREEAAAARVPPAWLRAAFSAPAWIAYAACALGAVVLFALRPGLLPRSSDIFFLDTPVRSLAALTAIMYVLAAAHELAHWLAARAVGVGSRITVSRRLYFVVLEIDLTGLWSLPRRRRYGALCAGMAFDAVVLFPLLLARYGDAEGWWSLGPGAARAVAALAFVEFAAIVSQFWVFARTDCYALLTTATGCVNLFRVNQLMVRRGLRVLGPEQRRELDEAHARDVAVARWFRWVYLAGLVGATWFFVLYFVPATYRLLAWILGSIADAGPASEHFWEALVFGVLVLSPRLLVLGVALRDAHRWLARRAASPGRALRGHA